MAAPRYGDPREPLSVGALREQAAKTTQLYRDSARERDAEIYGPGGIQRTMYDLGSIQDARSAMSDWTPFFQALRNNGVTSMRQAPTRDTIGHMGSVGSNQMGIRNTMMAETPESVRAINELTGGNPDGISPGELRLAPRPQFTTRPTSGGVNLRQRELGPTNSTAQSKMKVQGQRGGAYKGTR